MLVLSRHLGEKVLVGDEIVVSVVSIEGNKIRLGFEAPKGLKILREELKSRDQQRTAWGTFTVGDK